MTWDRASVGGRPWSDARLILLTVACRVLSVKLDTNAGAGLRRILAMYRGHASPCSTLSLYRCVLRRVPLPSPFLLVRTAPTVASSASCRLPSSCWRRPQHNDPRHRGFRAAGNRTARTDHAQCKPRPVQGFVSSHSARSSTFCLFMPFTPPPRHNLLPQTSPILSTLPAHPHAAPPRQTQIAAFTDCVCHNVGAYGYRRYVNRARAILP